MIICHTQRLIFVKTKKVAGTSFEIALSGLCGPDCTITPISPRDEALRRELGCRGPQNFQRPVWAIPGTSQTFQAPADFYNHMPAATIKDSIPEALWSHYRKVSIVRDPFDVAISMYYWQDHVEGIIARGIDFLSFVRALGDNLNFNSQIAPLNGDASMDDYLRYEHLHDDIEGLGLPGLADVLDVLHSKSNIRPRTGATIREVYARYPEATDVVARACRDQIETFGYTSPLQSAA